jgi:DNA-binding NarL/FixJ family response regulator
MPKEAKVLLVEDESFYRKNLTQYLNQAGHEVVLEAESRAQAEAMFPRLEEAGVQVALLDDRLVADDPRNHDGTILAKRIREEYPNVKVIDISRDGMRGVQGHTRANKSEGAMNIVDAVTNA